MLSCSGTLLCLNLNGMEGSAFGLYSDILHILGILKTLGGGGASFCLGLTKVSEVTVEEALGLLCGTSFGLL